MIKQTRGEQLEEQKHRMCSIEMEAICFDSMAGYLLNVVQTVPFYRFASCCAKLCCRYVYVRFLLLLQSKANWISLFGKLLQTLRSRRCWLFMFFVSGLVDIIL